MKTSNRILMAIGITAVALAVIVVVVARIIIGNVVTVPLSSSKAQQATVIGAPPRATKSYELKDFTGVAVSGAWEVRVSEGSQYKVTVSVADDMLPLLDVYAGGGVLHVGLKPGTVLTNRRMSATITMPSLDRIRLSGANRAAISGFTGDRLIVECSGAASITAKGQGYRRVRIDASGASAVRFRDLPTRNADVRISGAGQAELFMTGGELTGHLSGAGKVNYWGTVSKQTITTSGISSVSRR